MILYIECTSTGSRESRLKGKTTWSSQFEIKLDFTFIAAPLRGPPAASDPRKPLTFVLDCLHYKPHQLAMYGILFLLCRTDVGLVDSLRTCLGSSFTPGLQVCYFWVFYLYCSWHALQLYSRLLNGGKTRYETGWVVCRRITPRLLSRKFKPICPLTVQSTKSCW